MSWVAEHKPKLQLASFVIIMLAFPLLNAGLRTTEWMAWVGIAMVVIGFAVPPVVRLLTSSDDDSEDDSGDSEGEDG